MARVLAATRIESIDGGMGRRAGVLLSASRMADMIDAVVVLLPHAGGCDWSRYTTPAHPIRTRAPH